MTPERHVTPGPQGPHAGPPDLPTDADRLLRALALDDLGDCSPTAYDTARLVADAPWLDGHGSRLRWLCARQSPDGGWGDPTHALVPTLSATEALLASLRRHDAPSAGATRAQIVDTALRGLDHLARRLVGPASHRVALPGTVAVELIVPALVERINDHLATYDTTTLADLPDWSTRLRLELPPGCAPELLRELRDAAGAGRPLPETIWHTWEVISPAEAPGARVRPVDGAVGCSPSATAAWLGGPPADPAHPSAAYLRRVQRRFDGPVPGVIPIEAFEAARVLSLFAAHDVPHTPPPALLDRLGAALGPGGASCGRGLPPDADTTAAVLRALALDGREQLPDALLRFFTDGYFCTSPDERAPSPSTNAHALAAVALHLARHPDDDARYGPARRAATDWLLAVQRPDGSWADERHASPYYATASCATALAAFAPSHPRTGPALARAASWALDGQGEQGRWGQGAGTGEETAYAVWIILSHDPGQPSPAARRALTAAHGALRDPASMADDPPLWRDKDLYAPLRVLRATRLAALHTLRAVDGRAQGGGSAPIP